MKSEAKPFPEGCLCRERRKARTPRNQQADCGEGLKEDGGLGWGPPAEMPGPGVQPSSGSPAVTARCTRDGRPGERPGSAQQTAPHASVQQEGPECLCLVAPRKQNMSHHVTPSPC